MEIIMSLITINMSYHIDNLNIIITLIGNKYTLIINKLIQMANLFAETT